jgi:hypothetical protein
VKNGQGENETLFQLVEDSVIVYSLVPLVSGVTERSRSGSCRGRAESKRLRLRVEEG